MTARPRVRFERNASRVVFDPGSRSFVVTWSKCNKTPDERISSCKDPARWVPSISAITTLYDRGRVSADQIVFAAKAVGRAWDAGDRDLLDTEEAKKAAELVRDIAEMCPDPSSQSASCDVGQAMRSLLDEIAAVRFSGADISDGAADSVLESMDRAAAECLAEHGFTDWSARDMRRRFLYCLRRKECTDVVYTLVSLLFDAGACPLLSMSDRRTMRLHGLSVSGLDRKFDAETIGSFLRFALGKMRTMKSEGRSRMNVHLTQQQLTDSISQKTN